VKNLNFRHGLPSNEISGDEYFDVIVFAASIQYFKDFGEIIRFALRHLNANGQIHIMDTCFYSEGEIKDARKRSAEYFAKMGLPTMTEFYFHHSISSLKQFNYSKLFDPKTKMNKIFNRGQIFPWIVIEQDQ
jgi:ubiquinone/menaquinone biosynthesis C-methylase UbiE